MNQVSIKSKLLLFLSIVSFSLMALTACDDTETTDDTSFAIYYTGMTDIGPSMTGVISSPSYIGGKPYDFEIIRTTLNDESYSGNSFEIDKENGSITISQTSGIPVGHYKLTIKCLSNGKTHEFKDIVEINMMKPVPEGIAVEPNKLKVDYLYNYYLGEATGNSQDAKFMNTVLKLNFVNNDKYIADVSAGVMGSNKFRGNNRYATSYALGLGWIISE